MLCRRRKTALVPLSLAALVKAVAASECILTCQDCLATAGCAHAMNDKYWDCMEDLPCLQEAAWNVYSQAEGAEQFDCAWLVMVWNRRRHRRRLTKCATQAVR